MFRHVLTVTARNFLHRKYFTIVNLSGLVLGLTCCLMIFLYVRDEASFDRWLPDAERVYRYETEVTSAAGDIRLIRGSLLRARQDLESYFPEIEAATRLTSYDAVLRAADASYFQTLWFADPSFFDVFALPMVAGNRATALADKFSIVLSETLAEAYFPGTDPVGKLIQLDNVRDYRVTGVFADLPQQSHLSLSAIVPYDQNDELYSFGFSTSWNAFEGYTYLKLSPGVNAAQITTKLPDFLDSLFPESLLAGGERAADRMRPRLNPVTKIHLDPGGLNNIKPPGDSRMLITLSLIALLVLIIACVNYIGLSLSRSLERVKEVSIRKVVGARKIDLTWQFLCESLLMSLLATVISLGLLEMLLPLYNRLLDRQIAVDYWSNLDMLTVSIVALLALGIASGFYPAWRIASLHPTAAMRSRSTGGHQSMGLLKFLLVAVQFGISLTLILFTSVLLSQQLYIGKQNPGYSTDNKLIVRNMNESFSAPIREVFANRLRQEAAITGVAYSTAVPADTVGAAFNRRVDVPGYRDDGVPLYPKSVDPDFFDVYDIEIIAGRNFSTARETDVFNWAGVGGAGIPSAATTAVILNEAAVRAIGFDDNDTVIGQSMSLGAKPLQVVGVVPDVNFQDLRSTLTANMYIYSPQDHISLTVAYSEGVDQQAVSDRITAIWNDLVPGFPVAIEQLDNNIQAQYRNDRLQFLLMMVFTALAITLAGLGLYAFTALLVQQKQKEIGIRRVHGARLLDILWSVMQRFLQPIGLACLVAWPVAYLAAQSYLNGFQTRIDSMFAVFVLGSAGGLLLAGVTVALRSLRAANANPMDALRTE